MTDSTTAKDRISNDENEISTCQTRQHKSDSELDGDSASEASSDVRVRQPLIKESFSNVKSYSSMFFSIFYINTLY